MTNSAGLQIAEPDAELWRRATAGEPDAFATLYDRYHNSVYNYAFRRSGSWSVAEDLNSMAFLELWRRRKDINAPDGNVLPWLLGVVNNLVKHHFRASFRYGRMISRLPHAEGQPDFADEVAARVDDEARAQATLKALDCLSPAEREALLLAVWGGLRYDEIAVTTDVPVGTVRSRISRAKAKLRELTESSTGNEVRK